MRSGLLKKLTFPDSLLNQLVANLSDALNTLSGDDDVFTAPSTILVGTGKIPAGAATVFYRGAPAAQLTLPTAQTPAVQGIARAAMIVLGNESSGAVTLVASGGDTINGAKSLSVASGALAVVVSDGFSRWLVLAPAVKVPVLIDAATLSAATGYTSPTFAAEAYSKVWMEISGLETSASFEPLLTLGGVTSASAGATNAIYVTSAAQTVFSNSSFTYVGILDSAGGNIDVDGIVEIFPLTAGRKRHCMFRWSSSGVIGYTHGNCRNSDTTHGVTSVGWSGSTSFTGTVRVWGVPS